MLLNGSRPPLDPGTALWLPPSFNMTGSAANNAKAGRPASPNPALARINTPAKGIASVRPDQEYLLRGPSAFWQNYSSYLAALPRPTDNLDRELGLDVIGCMLQNPQINSSIYSAAYATLSRGLSIRPAVSDTTDNRYPQAKKIADFCAYSLDHLATPINAVLLDMVVGAMTVGNSVAEQSFKLQVGGPYDGKMLHQSIKPKHPQMYVFLVDRYGNCPAIGTYNYSWGTLPQANLTPGGTLMSGWSAIPIEKFAVMTFRQRYADPRGQSVLRAVYSAWIMLMQIWPEYFKYLVQFASPSIVGTLPEKAYPITVDGEIQDPLDVLYSELLGFANGKALALRYGAEIDLKWSQSDGGAFTNAINTLNHEMVKAILHQLLATEEGQHQARSASSVHQDIFNIATRNLKNLVVTMVNQQILKTLVRLNFGDAVADSLTPRCTLGDVAPEDRAVMLTGLSSAGYLLGPSQWPNIDAELELEIRSQEQAATDFKAGQKAQANTFLTKGTKPGGKPKPGQKKKPNPKVPSTAKAYQTALKAVETGLSNVQERLRAITWDDDDV